MNILWNAWGTIVLTIAIYLGKFIDKMERIKSKS
jgi:hypothetical protein